MSRLGVENFGAVSEALSERERAREATGRLARFGLERFASIDPVVRAPFHPRHEANRSGVEKAQSIYSCVLPSPVRGTEQFGGDVWHTTKVHCVKAVRLGRTPDDWAEVMQAGGSLDPEGYLRREVRSIRLN